MLGPSAGYAVIPSSRVVAASSWRRLQVVAVTIATLLVLSGCATNPSAAPPAAESEPGRSAELAADDLESWLDGLLPGLLEREGIAGAVVSVVADGQAVTERGYGYADTGAGGSSEVLVDPQTTLFRVGSITKPLVAVAAIRMMQEGMLDLDEPIDPHLDFDLDTRFDTPITMRHLLSHTAGFEERLQNTFLPEGTAPPSLREWVSHDPPEQIFEPGTLPAYSNYGVALAGYVLEQIAQEPFADLIQREVLDPAAMSDATLAQPPQQGEVARGYPHGGTEPGPYEIIAPLNDPAGSLSATGSDMTAFMLMLLESEDLLSEQTEPVPTLEGLTGGNRPTVGFYRMDRNGHRILTHGGDTNFFHAEVQIYPDEATGIYVGLNSAGVSADSTAAVRELVAQGFADRYFPDQHTPEEPLSTSAEHAETAAGSYLTSRRAESNFLRLYGALTALNVTAQGDGSLSIDGIADTAGNPVQLVEVEPWVWESADGRHRVAMHAEDDQILAIGLHPVIVLDPMPTSWALLPWAAAIGFVIVVLTALGWPAAALSRRRHRIRLTETASARRLRYASRGAALSTVVALGCWVAVALPMLSGFDPPGWLIRLAQAATAFGALGVVPALGRVLLWRRKHSSPLSVLTDAVTALGFIAVIYVGLVGGLLWVDISY